MLQICLSIKIHCLNVGYACRIGRLDEDEVRRETLILVHFDQLTDLQVGPGVVSEAMAHRINTLDALVVLDVVLSAPLQIFKQVLDHGDEDDGHEAGKVRRLTISDGNLRH